MKYAASNMDTQARKPCSFSRVWKMKYSEADATSSLPNTRNINGRWLARFLNQSLENKSPLPARLTSTARKIGDMMIKVAAAVSSLLYGSFSVLPR